MVAILARGVSNGVEAEKVIFAAITVRYVRAVGPAHGRGRGGVRYGASPPEGGLQNHNVVNNIVRVKHSESIPRAKRAPKKKLRFALQ